MAISKRLRYEILRRDNHACRYCGGTAPEVRLTVDHVLPTTLGGTDEASNLVAACADCNGGKASSSPDGALVDQVADDQIRFAKAIEAAAADMQADVNRRFRANKAFDDLWTEFCQRYGREWYRPLSWAENLETFRARGLTDKLIEDAFWIAWAAEHIHKDDRWRYFCGICWTRVKQITDAAVAVMAVEDADDGA